MSAIFYMVQDVKMMKNVPFVLMLFMGNVRVKSSGTLQIKGKVWFDSQSIVKSNLYLYRTKRKMRDALCKNKKF